MGIEPSIQASELGYTGTGLGLQEIEAQSGTGTSSPSQAPVSRYDPSPTLNSHLPLVSGVWVLAMPSAWGASPQLLPCLALSHPSDLRSHVASQLHLTRAPPPTGRFVRGPPGCFCSSTECIHSVNTLVVDLFIVHLPNVL